MIRDEPRPNFPRRTNCCLGLDPSNRHLPQAQVTSDAREKLNRWQEGPFILATLRPVGIALWLGLIAWVVDPDWMAWSSVSLPTWLRWTGVGMIAIACGLLVWTLRCLGKNLTDTVVTRQQHMLVMHGPYRWVRHPFYDSAALLAVAVSLQRTGSSL